MRVAGRLCTEPGVTLTFCVLLQQGTNFSWSLAASKGCVVSDNDIHALKSICGRLTDKGSAFHSTTER